MLEVMVKKVNKEEVAVCASRDVAETFGKLHKEVLYAIEGRTSVTERAGREETKYRGILQDLIEGGEHYLEKYFILSEYESRGKKYKEYLMTRDGFTLLVMGFSGEKAMRFKLAYIKQFNNMEKLLKEKFVERQKGITVRHIVTDMIKQSKENERTHGHAYSIYTDMIYKALFGKTAKQFREEFGIGKTDSLRDYFTAEELKAIQSKEMLVSSLIDCGWGYESIKAFVAENCQNQIEAGN